MTKKSSQKPIQLDDVQKSEIINAITNQIKANELEIVVKGGKYSKCIGFLNMPIVILFLSSIVIVGISRIISNEISDVQQDKIEKLQITHLALELNSRTNRAKNNYIGDVKPEENYNPEVYKTVIRCLNANIDAIQLPFLFPEYEKRGFYSLMIELGSLMKKQYPKKAQQLSIQTSLTALNNHFINRIKNKSNTASFSETIVKEDNDQFDSAMQVLNNIQNIDNETFNYEAKGTPNSSKPTEPPFEIYEFQEANP